MYVSGGTGKSGHYWYPQEAGQTDLCVSCSVLVLGSDGLEKDLFCLEEMCQVLPTFVFFLSAGDFLESLKSKNNHF